MSKLGTIADLTREVEWRIYEMKVHYSVRTPKSKSDLVGFGQLSAQLQWNVRVCPVFTRCLVVCRGKPGPSCSVLFCGLAGTHCYEWRITLVWGNLSLHVPWRKVVCFCDCWKNTTGEVCGSDHVPHRSRSHPWCVSEPDESWSTWTIVYYSHRTIKW